MSWLDALLGRIRSAGVDLALGNGLNFLAPLVATRNESTGFVDVSQTPLASSTSIVVGSDVQRAALTGDVTAPLNSNVTTIAALAVTEAKLAADAVTAAKLADEAVVPANLASSLTFGVPFLITQSLTGGVAGTADDVTIYNANAPFAFRILDCWAILNAAVGGSTIQLRDTAGGGGSALSSALSSAATGTVRNNDTSSRAVAANGSVFVRRSDRSVAGRIIILALRE